MASCLEPSNDNDNDMQQLQGPFDCGRLMDTRLALTLRKAVPRSMAMRANEMNSTVLSSLVGERDGASQRWLQGAT